MADADVTLDYLLENIWIVGSPDTVAAKLAALRDQVGGFGTLLVIAHEGRPRTVWERSMTLLKHRIQQRLVQARGAGGGRYSARPRARLSGPRSGRPSSPSRPSPSSGCIMKANSFTRLAASSSSFMFSSRWMPFTTRKIWWPGREISLSGFGRDFHRPVVRADDHGILLDQPFRRLHADTRAALHVAGVVLAPQLAPAGVDEDGVAGLQLRDSASAAPARGPGR